LTAPAICWHLFEFFSQRGYNAFLQAAVTVVKQSSMPVVEGSAFKNDLIFFHLKKIVFSRYNTHNYSSAFQKYPSIRNY